MDIRQSPQWGQYLSSIGWTIENVGQAQIFIRRIPLIKRSVIKIQHQQNPLPFSKIENIAKKHRAFFVLVEPEATGFNEIPLKKIGYRKSSMSLTHTATIHIDLSKPEKEILASLSENARRNIKKAQQNNLKVKIIFLNQAKDDTEFRKFYHLLTNLTKLKKFYVPGYGEFYKKMQAFKDNSILLFTYQKADPNPIAVVWLGVLKDTAVYMNTGITKDGYQLLANYLLVWEAIKLAKKLKLKLFDFEGIFDPRFPKHRQSWKNFSEFKKRFHGTLVEHPGPFIKWHSKPFKLLYLCNQIFSR